METSEVSNHPSSPTIIAGGIMSPDDDEQLFQFDSCDSTDKGKQRSLPVPIVVDSHDVFHGAALLGSPSSSSYRAFGSPSSSAAFSPTSFTFSSPDSYHRYASRNRSDESMDQPPSGISPKGKARATPIPKLPPLLFQPIELDPMRAMGSTTPSHDVDDLEVSSSNLSRHFQQTDPHSLADLSVDDDNNPQLGGPEDAVPIDPSAWYTLPRSPELNLPIHQFPNSTNGDFVLKSSVRALYRSKGRSKSSPFPLSALDFVPASDADGLQPLPLVVPNYFDLALPKELRIRVFQSLLQIHEDEHRKLVDEGRISFAKAASSRGRWVGRDKGIRELFKLTRVGLMHVSLGSGISPNHRSPRAGKHSSSTVSSGRTLTYILSRHFLLSYWFASSRLLARLPHESTSLDMFTSFQTTWQTLRADSLSDVLMQKCHTTSSRRSISKGARPLPHDPSTTSWCGLDLWTS